MIKAAVFAIAAGCSNNSKPADDCERAVQRLERIAPAATRGRAFLLDSCRTGKYAAYDPVLRCAMDSSTDAEAATCIERGVRDVVEPGAGGSGVNPLLP